MEKSKEFKVDLFAVAMLFVAISLITLALVGIAVRGSSPLFVLPPIALGVRAILDLEKK